MHHENNWIEETYLMVSVLVEVQLRPDEDGPNLLPGPVRGSLKQSPVNRETWGLTKTTDLSVNICYFAVQRALFDDAAESLLVLAGELFAL